MRSESRRVLHAAEYDRHVAFLGWLNMIEGPPSIRIICTKVHDRSVELPIHKVVDHRRLLLTCGHSVRPWSSGLQGVGTIECPRPLPSSAWVLAN